jgi:hypothetical protein
VFTFDEEEMRKNGDGRFVLKEGEETEKKGGGMGRSQVGVFGVEQHDFPPEKEGGMEGEGKAEELGEATREKPKV